MQERREKRRECVGGKRKEETLGFHEEALSGAQQEEGAKKKGKWGEAVIIRKARLCDNLSLAKDPLGSLVRLFTQVYTYYKCTLFYRVKYTGCSILGLHCAFYWHRLNITVDLDLYYLRSPNVAAQYRLHCSRGYNLTELSSIVYSYKYSQVEFEVVLNVKPNVK